MIRYSGRERQVSQSVCFVHTRNEASGAWHASHRATFVISLLLYGASRLPLPNTHTPFKTTRGARFEAARFGSGECKTSSF
jgi:hypothetical protein